MVTDKSFKISLFNNVAGIINLVDHLCDSQLSTVNLIFIHNILSNAISEDFIQIRFFSIDHMEDPFKN